MDRRKWILAIGLGALAIVGVVFNSGFRETLERRRAIVETRKEISTVSEDIRRIREDIEVLQHNPNAYELLVRRELGYLKPGEKEIRIINE